MHRLHKLLSDYEFNESDIEKKKQIKKKQAEEYMILCNDDNEGNKNVASLLQSIFRVIHFSTGLPKIIYLRLTLKLSKTVVSMLSYFFLKKSESPLRFLE